MEIEKNMTFVRHKLEHKNYKLFIVFGGPFLVGPFTKETNCATSKKHG